MPAWKYTLELKDVFRDWHGRTFEERRDEIVRRIKASEFWSEDDIVLNEIVEGLAYSVDLDEFDDAWDWFYDWADSVRVWVRTF